MALIHDIFEYLQELLEFHLLLTSAYYTTEYLSIWIVAVMFPFVGIGTTTKIEDGWPLGTGLSYIYIYIYIWSGLNQ